MALGTILREAREQQGYSVAQVAEATHMMLQIVEEIEREDFHRIAAPIYGRGFVKLYAEFLNIDAEPLVKEFNEIFSGSRRPVVATRAVKTVAESAGTAGAIDPGQPRSTPINPSSPSASPRLRASALESPAPAGTAGTTGASDPNQPRSTPIDPDARLPAPDSLLPAPAPSRVADELDDLFGPRPGAPERSALSVERSAVPSSASRLPPSDSSPATHHSPRATRFSPLRALRALRGKKRVERSALRVERSAFLPRTLQRLATAIPAGWRSGPALAGATAGLLVIAVCVGLIVRAQHRTPERSALERSASKLTTHHSPLTTPFVITPILPPPEPYVD